MHLWFEVVDGKPTVLGRYSRHEEPRIQFIFLSWEMANRVLPKVDRRKVAGCVSESNPERPV